MFLPVKENLPHKVSHEWLCFTSNFINLRLTVNATAWRGWVGWWASRTSMFGVACLLKLFLFIVRRFNTGCQVTAANCWACPCHLFFEAMVTLMMWFSEPQIRTWCGITAHAAIATVVSIKWIKTAPLFALKHTMLYWRHNYFRLSVDGTHFVLTVDRRLCWNWAGCRLHIRQRLICNVFWSCGVRLNITKGSLPLGWNLLKNVRLYVSQFIWVKKANPSSTTSVIDILDAVVEIFSQQHRGALRRNSLKRWRHGIRFEKLRLYLQNKKVAIVERQSLLNDKSKRSCIIARRVEHREGGRAVVISAALSVFRFLSFAEWAFYWRLLPVLKFQMLLWGQGRTVRGAVGVARKRHARTQFEAVMVVMMTVMLALTLPRIELVEESL